jgi:hypothetical protein
MKGIRVVSGSIIFLFFFTVAGFAGRPAAGFFLPDSVHSMTLNYRVVRGLAVLPVTINDSIKVNLILDTGCRNLILFGKKFRKLLRPHSAKPVKFSGLGRGRPLAGSLSLGNKVNIDEVVGHQIPVVVVPGSNLFGKHQNVHGVIGYEIFLKFEIELNSRLRTITFRPALKTSVPCGYTQIPLKITDARPVMMSDFYLCGIPHFL